jgi:hypothetical protein
MSPDTETVSPAFTASGIAIGPLLFNPSQILITASDDALIIT